MKLSWAINYARSKGAGAGGTSVIQNYGTIQGTVQRHNKDGSVIVKMDDGTVATVNPETDDILTEGVRVWLLASSVGFIVIGTVK